MNRFTQEFNPSPSDVTVCGSMAHKAKWLQVVEILRARGLIVATPDLSENTDWSSLSDTQIVKRKGWLIRRHLANIASTKTVLICNYKKNDTENYIGSNSFLEMGAAFIYGKPLYVLNNIPEQDNREEILALEPIVLNGNLDDLIKEVKQ
jgi:hypothetical protein